MACGCIVIVWSSSSVGETVWDSAVLMFDLVLASSTTHTHTFTQRKDCSTVSGWLMIWCDSFWLLRALWKHTCRNSLTLSHTHIIHTHMHTLTAVTEAHITSRKMGLLLLLSLLLHHPPLLALIPLLPLVIYCRTFHMARLETFCASGWCVNDHTPTHPPTVEAYCMFMSVLLLSNYIIVCYLIVV